MVRRAMVDECVVVYVYVACFLSRASCWTTMSSSQYILGVVIVLIYVCT